MTENKNTELAEGLYELWQELPKRIMINNEWHFGYLFSSYIYDYGEIDEWLFGKLEALLLKHFHLNDQRYCHPTFPPKPPCTEEDHKRLIDRALQAIADLRIDYMPNLSCNDCGCHLLPDPKIKSYPVKEIKPSKMFPVRQVPPLCPRCRRHVKIVIEGMECRNKECDWKVDL